MIEDDRLHAITEEMATAITRYERVLNTGLASSDDDLELAVQVGEKLLAGYERVTVLLGEAQAAVTRVVAVLNARHADGCTYVRMADIRTALDPPKTGEPQ